MGIDGRNEGPGIVRAISRPSLFKVLLQVQRWERKTPRLRLGTPRLWEVRTWCRLRWVDV